MPRLFRPGAPSLLKALRTLLIPLLLLFAQQGALLHGLSHVGTEQTQPGGKKHSTEACQLCQAFSQIESAEKAAAQSLPLLPGLSFALQPSALPASHAATRQGPNNRGPPLFL